MNRSQKIKLWRRVFFVLITLTVAFFFGSLVLATLFILHPILAFG